MFHSDDERVAFRARAFQTYFDLLMTIKLPSHPGSSLAHLAHFLRLHDPPNPRYVDPATVEANPNGRVLSLEPGSLLATGHLLVLMDRCVVKFYKVLVMDPGRRLWQQMIS